MPSRGIDYQGSVAPLSQTMDMVAAHMIRTPQIRYRLDLERRKLDNETAMTRARVASEAAQGRNYDAQARGHTAKAVGDEQRNAAFDRLNTGGGIAKLHGMISGTMPFDATIYDQAMGDMTQAFGVSGRDAIELIKQGAQAAAAKNGVPARANAEATGNITQVANNDANNATAIANQASRNATSTANNQERLKYSLNRPITVSRDSGVWNPETKTFDVPKPERPAGNANNFYDPATRQALTTLGEELAKNYALGKTNEIAKLESQIEAIKSRAKGNSAAPTLPSRPLRTPGDFNAITAPVANQEQDPDDPSEPIEEPVGREDDSRMPAAPSATAVPPAVSPSPTVQTQTVATELKLAQDAIRQGANPVKVAAKFKARTGQDLPQ